MKIFSNSIDDRSLGYWFRQRRFAFFKEKVEAVIKEKEQLGTLPVKILDLGGLESYWINMGFQNNNAFYIIMVNLYAEKTSSSNIVGVAGDATNLINFKNQEFDIVFSNSVIEHLYDHESQRKMSLEAQRVGRYHFIQTPNKHFFIEPHYLLPFFQYFSPAFKYSILTKTALSRGKKWDKDFARQYTNEIRLLSLKDMVAFFPKSKMYKEKFLGVTKSFTAHNF